MLSREQAHRADCLGTDGVDGVRQVVMIQPVWDAFVDLMYDRGLRIFRIPGMSEDELPTYAVTPSQTNIDVVNRRIDDVTQGRPDLEPGHDQGPSTDPNAPG